MRWWVGVALLGALGCGPQPGAPAKQWTVKDFVARRGDPAADFGGYRPADLVAEDANGLGLRVLPAVAASQTQAYVITDIWKDHPLPWLQPVWVPVTAWDAADPMRLRVKNTWNVFPVDVTGSFYSPYWLMQFVVAPQVDAPAKPGDPQPDFDSAADVLANAEVHPGGLVLCPLTVEGVGVEVKAGAPGPRHPYTGQALSVSPPRHAWVEGRPVVYLPLGENSAPWRGDVVEAGALYAFVSAAGALLPVPAVLPDAPRAHALVWRVDVPLRDDAAIFAPPSQPELRAGLVAAGQAVHPVATGIPADVANAYAGRVATDAACFLDAAFPASCAWWDSAAALKGVPKTRSTVLLTAAVLEKVTP